MYCPTCEKVLLKNVQKLNLVKFAEFYNIKSKDRINRFSTSTKKTDARHMELDCRQNQTFRMTSRIFKIKCQRVRLTS